MGAEFTDYVLAQLDGAGSARARKMFGGTGVYIDEVFCAIITGSGRFYLRVDESNRSDFESEEMEQFPGRGDSLMPYFEVPARVLEDPEELEVWAAKARVAALAARSSKPTRKKTSKKKASKKRAKKPRRGGDSK